MKKHAYLIMAHKYHAQLKELVKSLDDRRIDIFIHMDLKDNISEKEYCKLTQQSKVFL